MNKSVSNWIDSFLPSGLPDDQDTIRRHRLFIIINFLITLFAVSYGVMSYFIGFRVGMNAMIVSAVFFFIQPFLLKNGIRLYSMGIIFGIYTVLLNIVLVLYSGGLFISPVTPFIVLTSPLVLIFTNRHTALFFAVLSVLYVIVFAVVKSRIQDFPFTYNEKFHLMFLTLALGGLVLIFFLVTNTFENTKNHALKQLADEQKKSERLLLNILPQKTASELKLHGKTKPQRYESVTVMFTDFVEFTKRSEHISADDLVNDIDFYFREFDEIISRYNIEKIKTIGDSYMCAAGLHTDTGNHAAEMIHAALDIISFVNRIKEERRQVNKLYFDIRIGINSGPLVAGVVGSKKFAYDIWGDTVNTAARLQQSSDPGRINVSAATAREATDQFTFISRGRIATKNKEAIDMFFAEAKTTS